MRQIKYLKPFEDKLIENLLGSELERKRAQVNLFARYSYIVHFGKTRYMLSDDDSADAYSDTMLAVLMSISNGKFNFHCSLKTYVYQIFHHKCVDLIRRKTAQKNSIHHNHCMIELAIDMPDSAISSLEQSINRSEMKTVTEKLSHLNQSHRRILLLAAEGYSDSEIANMTKYNSADVVKTCRLRSLRKIRKLVS